MRIAGMYVAERLAREKLREGHRVVIRAQEEAFTRLAVANTERLDLSATIPQQATRIPATELAGVELTSEAARRKAEWTIMQTCRRPYDGLSDRFIFRAFSLRITRLVTRAPISPNHVTAVSSVFGLSSCILLAVYGSALALVLAGIALLTSVILDSVDGELARVRHMGSSFGMWFDNLSDDVIDTSLVACIGIAIGGIWIPIAIAASVARAFAAIVTYRGAAKLGHPGDVMAFRWWFESAQETEEVYEKITPLTLLRSLGRRDTYTLIFSISFIAGVPMIALLLGIANAVGHAALAVLHLLLNNKSK